MFGDFSSSLSKTFDYYIALLCKHSREIDSAYVRVGCLAGISHMDEFFK